MTLRGTWADGTPVRLLREVSEFRLSGTETIPAGSIGRVIRGDLFGGAYVQVQFAGEAVLRLIERDRLEEAPEDRTIIVRLEG